MINKISLQNFKVFKEEAQFPLSNINLLTGVNGRGKSTLLQSVLLLRQSLEHDESLRTIVFNGSCVKLGDFDDVRNVNVSKSREIMFQFELSSEENQIDYVWLKMLEDEDDEMVCRVSNHSNNLDKISPLKRTHYVAADRVGPQEFYIKSTLPDFLSVGVKGEFVGNVLLQKKLDVVNEEHLYISSKKIDETYSTTIEQTLIEQSGEWLSKILGTDDITVDVKDVGNRVIILSFKFGRNSTKEYKPSNVGFGYSYVLPIVVSGLIAQPNEYLIVENPEAHLHPGAQSRLIDFLAKVSQTGVQVFIESHSEHVLNALRIAVKESGSLSNEDVSILFFGAKNNNAVTVVEMDEDGGIDLWPDDFFDQQEKDLGTLLNF